jgi:tRNA(Ile)-lysidine synthase
MQNKFESYIKQKKLFKKTNKLILAVSGGMDSVALAHLLKKGGYNFVMAHCNFNLRGKDSYFDEVFVKNLSKHSNVKYYNKSFNTEKYAKDNNLSIQMAARELRYKWFEEIRIKLKYDFILIAHHLDDDFETFFINLLRGTGLRGLLGINVRNNKIVRPLLFAHKREIKKFIETCNIKYREDKSNIETKFIRNKIRLQLIPLLKEINPSFKETLTKDMSFLNEAFSVFFTQIERKKKQLIKKKNNGFIISILELKKLDSINTYLFYFLYPFGFSHIKDICTCIGEESGKQFFSTTHRIIIDRKELIIQPISKNNKLEILIEKSDKNCKSPIYLVFTIENNLQIKKARTIAMLDYTKLVFPLLLRRWKEGDRFVPLGMKRQKKLSDFFIDKKYSIIDKENVWLLCSGKDIVWIIGERIDDRYRITENTEKAYIVKLLKK